MVSAAELAWARMPPEWAPPELLMWDGRLDSRDDLTLRLGTGNAGERSDAAVVLQYYDRFGIPGLGSVIGDWSLVIRDVRLDEIVLASDFAGVRPLYYHVQRGKVLWSTDLQSLVDAAGVDTLDEEFVAGFLTCGGCPNRTPYSGIYSVPPGQAVCVTRTDISFRRFWRIPGADTVRYADPRRYDEQLRALFRDAVSVRLRAGAPAMAELSGGLDSSSVVCMANHLIRTKAVPAPSLTTISYASPDSPDAPFVRDVEAFCGTSGIHLSRAQRSLIARAAVGSAVPDGWEPLHDEMSTVARRLGVGAFLTGHGGDLVMGNWFDDSLQVAGALRRGHLGQAWQQALGWSRAVRIPVAWILGRALRVTLRSTTRADALYAVEGASVPACGDTSLLSSFCKRTGLADERSWFSDDWLDAPPERRKHFRALTIMRELRALQRPDAMKDLDYTHPFAHRPLVEFSMSIPADVLCGPGEPRRLMRSALMDMWPPRLRTRRSKGLFGESWVRALRPLMVGLRTTPSWEIVERGWVDRASLAARCDRLSHGLDCNVAQLRQILLLEYWLRNRRHRPLSEVVLQAS
jgi:asparagine synthase (glutamine-hydrolysing)